MQNTELSLKQTLTDKTIFVVGGSGFIGKVWLSMILDQLPEVKKIFILIRPSKTQNATQRFHDIYANSPVFSLLHHKYGADLNKIEKIEVVEGDIRQTKLGINKKDYVRLINDVDVTVNFAADLRFNAPLDEMLKSNTQGPLNIAEFISTAKKSKLVHVSTCYVAGMADGNVEEKVNQKVSPSGIEFSAEEEFNFALKEAEGARSRDANKHELTHIGILRANRLGWPNTYTYTKALGEILLTEKLPSEKVCIFRPSIVESSESYPFPGWNEDFNGTVPFIKMLSSRYRFLVAKPNNHLDVIPVDFVAKGLTIATCAILNNQHSQVYQSATSAINPMTVKDATNYISRFYKPEEKNRIDGMLLPYPKTRFINPSHILSGPSIKKMEKTITTVIERIGLENSQSKFIPSSKIKSAVQIIKNKAKIIDTIAKIYRPFVYDYNYTFKSDNLLSIQVVEKEFAYAPSQIKWEQYWENVHLPGVKKWCLPQLNKQIGSHKK